MRFSKRNISFSKILTNLDEFAIGFAQILSKNNVKYVVISGYTAILFGRNRMSEDIDILIEKLPKEKFNKLWNDLEKKFECIITLKKEIAYDEYLKNDTAIRFAEKGKIIPNVELKFVKNEIDFYSLNNSIKVSVNRKTIFISPIELQIAYKLFLGSEKDIEDARFLYQLFKEKLELSKLEDFIVKFNVKKLKKYLGDKHES